LAESNLAIGLESRSVNDDQPILYNKKRLFQNQLTTDVSARDIVILITLLVAHLHLLSIQNLGHRQDHTN